MESLDPRVERLPEIGQPGPISPKAPLDQFGTFEVFVKPKEGKPFQHEGIVHAPNLEMAYILAKETFTRRFTCVSLYVAETRSVFTSPTSDGDINAYDLIDSIVSPEKPSEPGTGGEKMQYEIYHLPKRGKQHLHVGSVAAKHPLEAMILAKDQFNIGKTIYNIWALRTSEIRFTSSDENDLWTTLPDKKFRDAAEYKGGEKLKDFMASRNTSNP